MSLGQAPLALFVYYRLSEGQQGAARAAWLRLSDTVREAQGIHARLLHREADPLVWMEIYEPVVDAPGLDTLLVRLAEESDFGAFLAPGAARVSEWFRAVNAPCA